MRVARELFALLASSVIPNPNRHVGTARKQSAVLRVKCETVYGIAVTVELGHLLSSGWVPKANGMVDRRILPADPEIVPADVALAAHQNTLDIGSVGLVDQHPLGLQFREQVRVVVPDRANEAASARSASDASMRTRVYWVGS